MLIKAVFILVYLINASMIIEYCMNKNTIRHTLVALLIFGFSLTVPIYIFKEVVPWQ